LRVLLGASLTSIRLNSSVVSLEISSGIYTKRELSMPADKKTTYIGDAVYAEWDGYYVILLTDSHDHPSNRILLEPEVFDRLIEFRNSAEGRGEPNVNG
jgi:hypothetical protein